MVSVAALFSATVTVLILFRHMEETSSETAASLIFSQIEVGCASLETRQDEEKRDGPTVGVVGPESGAKRRLHQKWGRRINGVGVFSIWS